MPNGLILSYNIYRDAVLVASVTGQQLNHTSDGLRPNTQYTFFVEASNAAGSTRSDAVMGRTLDGIPSGVAPPLLTAVGADSIRVSWAVPSMPNGAVVRYELVRVVVGNGVANETTLFGGLEFVATVTGLAPFTDYAFFIRACTSGGCGSSGVASIRTRQAPPTFQMQPSVTTLTATSLLVEWAEPEEPNGIVVQYEVRLLPAASSPAGEISNNISASARNHTVVDLRPFTAYEVSVVSYTGGGATQSQFTRGVTAESGE